MCIRDRPPGSARPPRGSERWEACGVGARTADGTRYRPGREPHARRTAASMNSTVCGLRFVSRLTLGRADIASHLPFVRQPHKLPIVLSPEEVSRFLEAAPSLKYKAAFSVAYGAGLRASEVTSLKPTDIDSKRMVIRVEQGKGRKDRYVMLSPQLLELLRDWWHVGQPQGWLFPGRVLGAPLTTRQLNRACVR